MVDVRQDGRLHEETIALQQLTASHHPRTFLAGQFDVFEHALLLLARHQRVDRRVAVHARANRHCRDSGGQGLDESVVDRAVHIEA
ncbi:hypothetical protein D3C78_1683010 [compost metagenome]